MTERVSYDDAEGVKQTDAYIVLLWTMQEVRGVGCRRCMELGAGGLPASNGTQIFSFAGANDRCTV